MRRQCSKASLPSTSPTSELIWKTKPTVVAATAPRPMHNERIDRKRCVRGFSGACGRRGRRRVRPGSIRCRRGWHEWPRLRSATRRRDSGESSIGKEDAAIFFSARDRDGGFQASRPLTETLSVCGPGVDRRSAAVGDLRRAAVDEHGRGFHVFALLILHCENDGGHLRVDLTLSHVAQSSRIDRRALRALARRK